VPAEKHDKLANVIRKFFSQVRSPATHSYSSF